MPEPVTAPTPPPATVTRYASASLPTQWGRFQVVVFHNSVDEKEHLAVVKGDVADRDVVPVRIHSECLTSEVLGSLKCDCRQQLDEAFRRLSTSEYGLILYLRQEGRGIGLGNKIRAYALQDEGLDTVDANVHLGFVDDLRQYDVAAAMLKALGVTRVSLQTNNPRKVRGLEEHGIGVAERVPVVVRPNAHNLEYLRTKARKSGHLMGLEGIALTGDLEQDEPSEPEPVRPDPAGVAAA